MHGERVKTTYVLQYPYNAPSQGTVQLLYSAEPNVCDNTIYKIGTCFQCSKTKVLQNTVQIQINLKTIFRGTRWQEIHDVESVK
jgi:hypothetical protein